MTQTIVDLSVPIANDIPADRPVKIPRTKYLDHTQVLPFFPGVAAEDLPNGEGWAVQRVTLSTHNGTHIDASWNYHSTIITACRRSVSMRSR